MGHMFAGDPWYNGKGQQGGVQGMGFRPGPVQVGVVRQLQVAAPTFGATQAPAPAMNAPFASMQQPVAAAPVRPATVQQQMAQQQAQGGQKKSVPIGSKADCPVCHKGPGGF